MDDDDVGHLLANKVTIERTLNNIVCLQSGDFVDEKYCH
jgi:hypothetical protein